MRLRNRKSDTFDALDALASCPAFCRCCPACCAASRSRPVGAAKDTGLIFVSNEKTNNIIVIDPKTYKVVKDMQDRRAGRATCISTPITRKLYVACGDDDVIDIIDVASSTVIGKLSTGPSPETFAIDEKRGTASMFPTKKAPRSRSSTSTRTSSIQEIPTGRRAGRRADQRGRQDRLCHVGGRRPRPRDRRRQRHVTQDVVVGTRPRRFAAHARRQGTLGIHRIVRRGLYHRPRRNSRSKGKIDFLPPGMRKIRRDAGRTAS